MKEPADSLSELRSLLAGLGERELDASGFQRIEQLVRGDPAARQLYIDFMLLHGELRWASAKSTVPIRIACDAGRRPSLGTLSRRLPLFGAAVAAGLLVAAGIMVHRVAGPEPPAVHQVAFDTVAELRSDDGCVWAGREQALTGGTELLAGERLELAVGVARLSFRQGATVLVEGPTAFELVSATSLRLERGTVAVRASGPVKDFVVISPDASIVDLGTSFAVHYDEESATEVEVFEGGVEVFPGSDRAHGHVVEMGTAVSVGPRGKDIALIASPPEVNRFATLLELLWQDMRVVTPPENGDPVSGGVIEADFSDAPSPDSVDTFYDAKPGHGWLTPWVAAGNPTAEILRGDPAFGRDPFLQVRFTNSHERAVAREYGSRGTFDPREPHVISWRWRLDGSPDEFGGDFHDRVAFYGNPFFRRNSWPTNSWLVGVAGGDETTSGLRSSNEWLKRERGLGADRDGVVEEPRRVIPMRWYFFNSQDAGGTGSVFDRRNMVDTGMPLKFGVLYRFAVAVYPQEGRYDAAIRDDERTVVRTDLSFRDRTAKAANVFHATVSADQPTDDRGFSLDSVRIQPLDEIDMQKRLDLEAGNEGVGEE